MISGGFVGINPIHRGLQINWTTLMPKAAGISWYFVRCLSASETLAQVQPRIACLDLGMSTFLQLWVLGICQHGCICFGTGATPLPAPAAWPGYCRYDLGQKKKGSETHELWINEMTHGSGQGRRWLHSMGVLVGGSRGLMCSSNAGKKAGIWAVLALTCWDLRLGTKV